MRRAGNKIKGWMAEKEIKVLDIARKAGLTHSVASETIHGKRNNRKILQALLALPADMKGKHAA